MRPVRTAARAMLATVFVSGGATQIKNPDRLVPAAKRFTDRIAPVLERADPRLPTDARTLVQVNGVAQLVGGLLLLTPLRRPAAIMLAGTLLPTTYAGHPFWEHEDPAARRQQQSHVMKNLGLLGGLLLAAADTEGRPSVGWRATHAVTGANRSVRRGARHTRDKVRVAVRAANLGRRLAG